MVKSRRWRLALLVTALGAIGLVFALRTERAAGWACETLRTELPRQIPFEVKIGSCAIDPLEQGVRYLLADLAEHEDRLAAAGMSPSVDWKSGAMRESMANQAERNW